MKGLKRRLLWGEKYSLESGEWVLVTSVLYTGGRQIVEKVRGRLSSCERGM